MKYSKIEIIVSNSFFQDLITRLEKLGVHGYTALEISRGKGAKKGEQLSEGLLPITRNSLVFTVAPENLTRNVITHLQPYLDERGGIIITYPIDYASGLS